MYDKEYHIFGYDIDSKIIPIARENAIKAGVDDCIHFQTQPMNELKTHYRYGTIVCNPPYGERLNEVKEVEARSEEHTSELQSRQYLVCRLLLEKKKQTTELKSRQ